MRFVLKTLLVLAVIAVIGVIAATIALPRMNDRQTNGEITLTALDAPIRIVRDANAVPYIYADSLKDALRGQGFVVGQDRLFQIEAAKRAAAGRLSEVFGAGENDVILNLDREARVIGFSRLAARQSEILSSSTRETIAAYLDGLNAYILTRQNTHPLEFRLAGFEPEPWTETDVLSVMYYLGWASSGNLDAELTALKVIQTIGAEKFEEIAPIVVNPDDEDASPPIQRASGEGQTRWAGMTPQPYEWVSGGWRQQGYGGSNNWVINGEKSGQKAAIVTNDPHLDSRSLPGPWHPIGLITPELRVVGATTGLPGIVVGRNEHIAFGVTNAYSDAVDVYVETLDPLNPDRYLEGDQSIPFDEVIETIRIKDDAVEGGYRNEELVVRLTRRGPVITDHDTKGPEGAVLSMRWASADYMQPDLGIEAIMQAKSIDEALSAIESIRVISLNFVVGDTEGRIARRASGAAPIRLEGDGMTPFPVGDGTDNWAGPIPPSEMPGEIDPERGWTGTANHMTAPADYPYVYTSYASPSYRYRRMRELLEADQLTAEDVWAAQYDTVNVFARDLAPIFAEALMTSDDDALKEIGRLLSDWDYSDDSEGLETTLFQEIVRQLAVQTYEDELGEDATKAYLANWYVWQERFDAMVQAGNSPWFDDTRTQETEDLTALIHRAVGLALDRLTADYGPDRSKWLWGERNQMRFNGPLRLDGLMGKLTGNRNVPMSGSGETLKRALYPFHNPFDTQWTASLRMTADLNDPDKIRAVLPGGAVGRTFHRHLADQTAVWADDDAVSHWWFSDDAISQNTKSELLLTSE